MLYNEVQYVGIWFNALFLDGRYPNLKPVKTSVEQMLNIAIFAKIIMKLLTISLQANSNKLRLVIMLGGDATYFFSFSEFLKCFINDVFPNRPMPFRKS